MSFEFREHGRGCQLRSDHSKFIHSVIHALKHTHISTEDIFSDDRWNLLATTISEKAWMDLCESAGIYSPSFQGPYSVRGPCDHAIFSLIDTGYDPRIDRAATLALVEGLAPTLRANLCPPLKA